MKLVAERYHSHPVGYGSRLLAEEVLTAYYADQCAQQLLSEGVGVSISAGQRTPPP